MQFSMNFLEYILFQDIVQPVATGTAQGRFNPIESRKPSNLTPMKLGCPICVVYNRETRQTP